MSSFNEIMQSAVEQLSSFFENQLEIASKSLEQYDEHVNAACILKQNDVNDK